jgi:hypothetical protein
MDAEKTGRAVRLEQIIEENALRSRSDTVHWHCRDTCVQHMKIEELKT